MFALDFPSPRRRGLLLVLAGAIPITAFGASAVVAQRGGPAAAVASAPAAAAAPAPAAAAPSRAVHDCAGAADDLVTVELTPSAVAAGPGGERLAVAIDVHHHFADPAAIVGAVEVIDDRGRRVGTSGELAVRALPARSKTAYQVDTPDRLADGFYRMQVTVLARPERGGDTDDFSIHQLYFHVTGGALTPVTSHEWLTRSASGLAFKKP
jgi:hypothetical protein